MAKLLRVRVELNNHPHLICLDTGAMMDIMSIETANLLGIKIDESAKPIKIKNIHQKVQLSPLSDNVMITIANECFITTRFALIDCSVETIMSLPTMQKLKIVINTLDKSITIGSAIHKCYATTPLPAGEQPASPDTPLPSIIQQSDHLNPLQIINESSSRWSTSLSEAERERATALLLQYKDTWFKPRIGRCTTVEMEIKVTGLPKRFSARPVPVNLRDEMKRQISDLLEAKAITRAPKCEWVSACQLVPKPRSTKWRLVIDYRYINTLVHDDGYQMPLISDLLIKLSGARYFTLIDLNWGFWNVSLSPQSRQYTGFVVPGLGVFTWNVMPFGLKTSPTIFQRAIEMALAPLLLRDNVSVYIDDIIIFTDTISEQLDMIEKVLLQLHATGFYINFEKMKFMQEEVLYLGHIIGHNTLKPDPSKITALVQGTAPQDKKSLLSFCAAASYLRAFIPRFSELMEPLTRLTGKFTRFNWETEQQDAFEIVKIAIADACYLTMPKWDRSFVIFTDASDIAVAAVLTQLDDDEANLNFISFASKKLNQTQKNWSPTERELYAIVWACEHFEQYIKGKRPLIYSDHQSLEHLLTAQSPKMRRWALRLSEFDPYVTHIAGNTNCLADWLSRSIPLDDDELIPDHCYVPQVYHLVHLYEDSFTLPTPAEMISEAKAEEATMKPGTIDWYDNAAYGRISRRMYIPTKFRLQILLWFHCSRFGGHQGITRTVNRLRKFVWWPQMQQYVVEFINACPICNAIKPLPSGGGQQGALDTPNLFQIICMDFIGPRHLNGTKTWVLVIVDHYSRFMVTVPTLSTATPFLEDSLRDHWVAKFGIPRIVLCDRGPEFKANAFKNYVRGVLMTTLLYTSTEYPQGNGINESSHRILETAIQTNTGGVIQPTSQLICESTLLYNCTPNKSIGDTPASLVFGVDLYIPGLEDFEPTMNEEARLMKLRNFRGIRYLTKQLGEIEELAIPLIGRSTMIDFKVGDIVTYRLKESERDKYVHFSLESKYNATRSFPQRIVRVTPHDIEMIPIWTRGVKRRAPKEQCKLISTFIPELMREEAKLLYPYLPWISTVPKEAIMPSIENPMEEEVEQESATASTSTTRARKRFRTDEKEND
jgi:hypothetical protein